MKYTQKTDNYGLEFGV